MRVYRVGTYRNCGETNIFDCKFSEVKDLELVFNKVLDFHSRYAHHNYTVRLSNEELDQLLEERNKRVRRENITGSVVLENAKGNPEAKERLWKLLDQNLEQASDRKLFGL